MVAPRIFVVPSSGCSDAVILRRGPTNQVAALGWNRDTDEITMGQWLKGRIYEFRCDLSPDGRHFIYFAGNGDPNSESGGWWTAISRAPYLHALHFLPQNGTWHGGGAFTATGEYWLNGISDDPLQTDEITPCKDATVFPHSTDGFWMGDLYAARMVRQGWSQTGSGYEVVLRKPLSDDWTLRWTVVTGQKNRALVAGLYALEDGNGAIIERPGWDWADTWRDELRVAEKGQLLSGVLFNGKFHKENVIHDFNDMTFKPIRAPYDTRTDKKTWP